MARTNPTARLQRVAGEIDLIKSTDGADNVNADLELPTEEDLVKAMGILESTALGMDAGQSVRQQDLAARFAAGADLSKSERDELSRLINGDDEEDFLAKSTREEFAEDATITEGWEMSSYLDARDNALAKSLDGIKQALISSTVENSAVVGRLAKGLHAVGMSNLALRREVSEMQELVKSLTGIAGQRPVGAKGFVQPSKIGQKLQEAGPRGTDSSLSKSAAGPAVPQGHAAQKQWLNDGLTELIKSTEPGGVNAAGGFGVIGGVDLVVEQAKLENANQLSPAAMQLVQQHYGVAPTNPS